jgi:hypothetical protein
MAFSNAEPSSCDTVLPCLLISPHPGFSLSLSLPVKKPVPLIHSEGRNKNHSRPLRSRIAIGPVLLK